MGRWRVGVILVFLFLPFQTVRVAATPRELLELAPMASLVGAAHGVRSLRVAKAAA